ncbi:DUF2905 domain-containing protein [Paenibacillus sp. TRM 82003]|nr:DUF2905 domain-containing protein [Paenibacillus sp. TRM 82003]
MNAMAKLLITAGVVLVVLGVVWQFGGKYLQFLGRLPGDIRVERENMSFYFPIVTCILISVVGSLILYLIRLFR